MSSIDFEAKITQINSWNIIELPQSASSKLPSRGMVFVKGTINDLPFQEVLDPDGKGSHWFQLSDKMLKSIHAQVGDSLKLSFELSKEWPEPEIPYDIKNALTSSEKSYATWLDATPMARWEWVRWVGSTKNKATREKRIKVSLSKLERGMKRPCCFNRSMCLITDVSRNGVLLNS